MPFTSSEISPLSLNLSASGNPIFALGTQSAIAFEAALCRGMQDSTLPDGNAIRYAGDDVLDDDLDRQGVLALWADCFESHVVWDGE